MPRHRRAQPSAAEAFFGGNLSEIRQRVEDHWRREITKNWEARHAKANALSHRLTALEQATASKEDDAEGLWDKTCVLLDLKGDKEAEPLLRRVLALRPDHHPAMFHLGRILLEDGREEGEGLLEKLMAQDEEVVPQACSLLHGYYRRAGRTDRLRELDARMDVYEKDLAASPRRTPRSHRSRPTHSACSLGRRTGQGPGSPGGRTGIVPRLARAQGTTPFPQAKLFLLCVHARPAWHRLPSADRDQDLVNRLSRKLQLPGRVLVFGRTAGFRPLARKSKSFRVRKFSRPEGRAEVPA